jgi:sugar phosphate isomerase/epimerase
MKTRTGNFPIGFRRGWSDWQQNLAGLLDWTQAHGLAVIDLGRDGDRTIKPALEAGLRVGSVDLLLWKEMISPDKGQRAEAIAQNGDYVRACAAHGPMNHFLVMLPANPELPRPENFGYMVESFNQLAPILEQHQARLVIEGWPGPGALCCTPEGYRAFFNECPSTSMGINFDPSHLIRMGIDPIRFLREFVARVFHVHGKDTELLTENLYEYGSEQPATFAQPIAFGSHSWRYTIPGHGVTRWVEIFRILEAHQYAGCVSIELEDANFNGMVETEQLGILLGANFLTGC